MDELIPQQKIEAAANEFNITELEEEELDALNERLKNLQIKFQANKMRRKKEYGRK